MTNYSKRRVKIRVKNPKRLALAIAIFILLIFIIFGNRDNVKKRENLALIVDNENVTTKLENEIIISDSIVYLSFQDIKKSIDENIYKEDDLILTGSAKKIAAIELDKDEVEINGSKVEIENQAFKTEQGIIYLPVSEMQNIYDIQFSYIKEYKNIIVESYSKSLETAELTKNVSLKEENKGNSSTLEKMQKGDKVIYIGQESGWAKIRTKNGNIGYINKGVLSNFKTEREEMAEQDENLSKNDYYEKNITQENIKKYKNRKSVIEETIKETVNKKKNAVKIIYKNDQSKQKFKRFKLEATAYLKECGISVVFE